MAKKSEQIIETKEIEQKTQTQIERGRCDKKRGREGEDQETQTKWRGSRDSDKTKEGDRRDLWILE